MTKKLELQNGRAKNVNFSSIALNSPTSTKTSSYTTTDADEGKVIPVDSTTGIVDVTLHTPSYFPFIVTVKDLSGTAATNNISVVSPTLSMDSNFGTDKIITNYGGISFLYDGVQWYRIAFYTGAAPIAARGIFGGGIPAYSIVIDYITIATAGNATNFGNLTVARIQNGSLSSSIRGLFGGGDSGSVSNVIDYVNIATAGNAIDFGDLTSARLYVAGSGNQTRGIWAGGTVPPEVNTIDYVTIATTGNATNFGNLLTGHSAMGAFASPTRSVFGGGSDTGGETAVIEYVTIATTGNAINFGNLTTLNRNYSSGCSSATRGLFGGGGAAGVNVIDYVTIATVSNAIDFGDLVATRTQLAACSNPLRGVFAGGYDGAGATNAIAYVTINTLGNATNFGNLTVARRAFGGCSNGHGGL